MDLIKFSIQRPVTVAVGVILLVMFGLIGLGYIPVQLTPTVDEPIVTVTTNWPGRSPQEIVDEITREQEKRLKNVTNLKNMRSTSAEGGSTVTLEFYLGADISRALQEVSDALRQVPEYPDDVDEPIIKAADGASENAIAWIIIDVDPAKAHLHPDYDITTLYDALDKEVKPYIERIDGVAEVNIYGGREREVRVMLDPVALAQRSLNQLDVIEALRATNQNISAGTIAEGKRDYRVRVIGQYVVEKDILDTVVAYREGKPVMVRDVGVVDIGHTKLRGFVRSFGYPSLAMNVIRQSNANVINVMEGVREKLEDVRTSILPNLDATVGPDLRMRQVYDETGYINSAIDLVKENLLVGAVLSAIALIVFLRSFVATGLIALAIPVSVIGTFLVMLAFGRTLNVISLAGLAFATGVVVDNATVVLENTYRRRQMGDGKFEAAYRGAKEVWGAILASTLTGVAVFVPVITIQEEAGQLFRDISIALAVSVLLSLVISITVIPCACARWLGDPPEMRHPRTWIGRQWATVFGIAPFFGFLTRKLGDLVLWLMTGWRAWSVRPLIIVGMVGVSLAGSYLLMPPMDYLPKGNRNLVFGGLLIPPGYSVEQMNDIAQRIERRVKPYTDAATKPPEEVAKLPPIPRFDVPGQMFAPVPIENFFIGAFGGGMFVGATSAYEDKVIPVGNLLTMSMNSIPDAYGGAQQTSIFGRGIGTGNSVNVEISGPDLGRVVAAAQFMFNVAAAEYSYGNVRPDPSNFNLAQPEWRVRLNDRGRELGLTVRDIGVAVRGLFDGAFVNDFTLDGDTVDLVVLPEGGKLEQKERLASIPISTPAGRVVPLDSVVDVVESLAPQSIQRIEELPSVTVLVTPRSDQPVGQLMDEIRENVVKKAQDAGLIDHSMRIRLEGTAAQLDDVTAALFGKPTEGRLDTTWQKALAAFCAVLGLAGLGAALFAFVRAVRRGEGVYVYGGLGALMISVVVGGFLLGIAWQPQLATARFVWALLVTYLLMASLFESFLYPFVIMFSVPPAIVGGFGALWIVHRVSMMDATKPAQQLDVLTMLGFVMLIGTVVANAILLVEQAINFMNPQKHGGSEDERAMPPLEAIAESVRTRVRPIALTSLTTVTGGLPLVFAPGAGSEMYRGLGAVVLGGLVVSTFFTLLLVPMVFSLVLQMREGLAAMVARRAPAPGRVLEPVTSGGRFAREEGTTTNGEAARAPGASSAKV